MIAHYFEICRFKLDVGSGPAPTSAPTSAPTQPPSSGSSPKPAQCGIVPTENRIVGGENAAKYSNPWQVSLQKPTFSGSSTFYHFCGGSIISDTYIVTAAHCVENQQTNTWRIVVGGDKIKTDPTGEQVFSVKRATMHASYSSSTFDNDIAILELSSKITFNDGAQAVCISKTRVSDGATVRVSGWGTTASGGSSPDILQQVEVDVMRDSLCSTSDYYGNEYHSNTMLCAGFPSGGKDSCQGDSGGPLVRKGTNWVLEGVVSWGYGCAGAKKPGIYARVSNYRNWLVSQTGIDFD